MDIQIAHIVILVGVVDLVILLILRAVFSRRGWPAIEGTIKSVTIEKHKSRGRYLPQIEYTYTVRGETYTNTKVNLMTPKFPTEWAAWQYCKNYTEGERLKVYHHPRDPQKSLLEPDLPAHINNLLLFQGIGFMAAGLVWLFMG